MSNRPGYVRLSASQSFNEDEVVLLGQLLETLLRGGDTRTLVRHQAYANLVRKTQAMKQRIAEQRQARLSGKSEPEVDE